MKLLKKKLVRSLVSVFLVALMTLSITASALAYTGVYLGAGFAYKASGFVNTEVRGYVYYNSNNTSQIDVYSLCQWVFNSGSATVNVCEYLVNDPNFTKYTTYTDYITPITQGNYRRMELDWASICYLNHYNYNTSYNKNGSFAFIELLAANIALAGGEWDSFWFSSPSPGTSYSASFNQ